MRNAKITITFEGGEGPLKAFELAAVLPNPYDPEGESNVADTLQMEFKKEVLVHEYHAQLPDVTDFLGPVKQTSSTKLSALLRMSDRHNTRWIWFEIGNHLLRIEFLLAQARAYKDLEPPHSADPRQNNLLYNIHLLKMDKFDLASLYLVKVEDLLLRLLLENLGGRIGEIDAGVSGWERRLTWEKFKEGVKDRASNPSLSALKDDEYNTIADVIRTFRNPHYAGRSVLYRDSITHRVTPSVDYPELYIYLQSRIGTPIYDSSGQKIGEEIDTGLERIKAEYEFLSLYANTVKTLEHYVTVLRSVKSVPRFSPEAIM
jgi:hypothetical protein